MSVTSVYAPATREPNAVDARSREVHSSTGQPETWLWIARATIVAVAVGLTWYTWGHWGDFQIDNGRELYVPAEILKGRLLFRDLWYMYGPLAAYVNAGLFWIFGVRLEVLYAFGSALTIGTALVTFETGRRFNLGVIGSATPAFFFLAEAFYPFIRNFVFPYSYAASLGCFLGSLCLYFVILHASTGSRKQLLLAALLASLVILTKQEFGAAVLVLLGFEVLACYWMRRSATDLVRNIATCAAGLLPAVAGYGWFVWKVGARAIFWDNWIQTPGTWFMRTYGKITIPQQGLRFVPSELLQAAEHTAVGVAFWALIALVAASSMKETRRKSRATIGIGAFVCTLPLWLSALAFNHLFPWGWVREPTLLTSVLVIPLEEAIFPTGIFFIAVLFTCFALWKMVKERGEGLSLQESALGIYAMLVAVRQMMELRPTFGLCSVYFNVPIFLIFIFALREIFRWASRSLDEEEGSALAGGLFAAEIGLVFLLFSFSPRLLPSRLTTDNGTFYTRPDVAELFPKIISFMKSHTRNGKDILVIPEPASLYVFSGMEAPSRMYGLVPGYVSPDQEPAYINDLIASRVRYILITNRVVYEYGVRGFANGGYNKPIHDWITANYQSVGQFGPVHNLTYLPFIVWVYERNDLVNSQPADPSLPPLDPSAR